MRYTRRLFYHVVGPMYFLVFLPDYRHACTEIAIFKIPFRNVILTFFPTVLT